MLSRVAKSLVRMIDAFIQLLRRARLRLGGAALGRTCHIGRHVTISGDVRLGNHVTLQDGVVLSGNILLGSDVTVQKLAEVTGNVDVAEGVTIGSYSYISTSSAGHVRIGRHTLVNSYNVIGASKSLIIGEDCIFAACIQITDASHAFQNRGDSPRHGPAVSEPVVIGPGTWLGAGAKVLKGVTVGEGCVIGAGAVVTKDLPSFAIAVGMPARVLRLRDEPGSNEKNGR